MTYPIINTINDVLPSIVGRPEFVVADRPGYRVIDYNYAISDSFDDPMRRECRGLKFAPDGRLIGRPLHKFHNIGETPSTQVNALDFGRPHVVTEKLDGSMVHAAYIGGEIVLMTRMGHTDVAIKAQRHLVGALRGYCIEAIANGVTPIFEFTAPDNRIVIGYPDSRLTLLAMRRMRTGEYLDRLRCAAWARDAGIGFVQHLPSSWSTAAAFVDYARAVTGREGFVVRFDDGLWVKAKGDDYVLKHRAKDAVLQEKNVLALVLSGGIDDVLPLLDDVDRNRVVAYRDAVQSGMASSARQVVQFVAANDNASQKEFAVDWVVPTLPAPLRPIAFQVRAGTAANDAVAAAVSKRTGSASDVDAVRSLHGATWR